MPWLQITRHHVLQRATPAEIGANEDAGKPAVVKADALDEIIKTTTIEVRAAIQEGGKTSLDSNEKTIPASLLNHALSIIVFLFASRVLRQDLVVQDARYRAYKTAVDALDDVRAGKRVVEDPDTGEVSGNNGAEALQWTNIRFTRKNFVHF
ncbi:MAG: DUF1320 family protein [Bacteroidales bacterium]|nr:DUF1320 family protein [Bacteroidales bacterium]